MPNPPLSDDELDRILDLRQQGLTYRQIRDETGHSLGRISETIQEHELEAKEQRVRDLEQDIENLQARKRELRGDIDRMRDEAEVTRAAIDAVTTLRDAGVDPTDVVRLAGLIQSAKRVNYDAAQLVQLLEAHDRLRDAVHDLTATRDQLEADIEDLTARRDRLDAAVDDLTQTRSQLRDRVARLRDHAREAMDFPGTWSAARDRLDEIRGEVRGLEARAERLRSRIDGAASLDGAIAHLRARKDRLTERVARLDDIYAQAYREINVGLGVYRLVFESFPDGFAGLVHLHLAGQLGSGLLDGVDPRLVAVPAEEIRSTVRELLGREVEANSDEEEWLAAMVAMGGR